MEMGSVVHTCPLAIGRTNVTLTWGEGPSLVSVGWVTDGGGISLGIPFGTFKEQTSSPISKLGPWRFSGGGGFHAGVSVPSMGWKRNPEKK